MKIIIRINEDTVPEIVRYLLSLKIPFEVIPEEGERREIHGFTRAYAEERTEHHFTPPPPVAVSRRVRREERKEVKEERKEEKRKKPGVGKEKGKAEVKEQVVEASKTSTAPSEGEDLVSKSELEELEKEDLIDILKEREKAMSRQLVKG